MSMVKFSLNLNPEKTMEDLLNSPIPLVGIVILLVMLNVFIIIQDFYSNFRCSAQFFLSILFCSWKFLSENSGSSDMAPVQKKLSIDRNVKNQMVPIEIATKRLHATRRQTRNPDKLSLQEVKIMVETLTSSREADDDDHEPQGRLGSREIDNLFEEDPSLEEAKEAFGLFDDNNDGFIDAGELLRVLCTFGFTEMSEAECRKMIRNFDENGDGRIDFDEFVKLLESSFC